MRNIRHLSSALLIVAVLIALSGRWQSLQAAAQPVDAPQIVPHAPELAPASNGGDNSGGNGSNSDDIKVYGVVSAMPNGGLLGSWVISGTTYLADGQTEFEQEHGGFAVGVCVELEAETSAPTLATKIATESAYKCTGSGDDDGSSGFEGKFYGAIVSLPAGPGYIGTWVVGSETLLVNASTRLEQEDALFAVGVVVKVEFRELNGEKIASEIEAKTQTSGSDDSGDDNSDDSSHDGQAFGPIVSLPAGMIGTWNIAGLDYTATANTVLDDEGTFAPGVNVKVEYNTTPTGERIAREIEITSSTGGVTDPNAFKFVGWVRAKPQSYLGDWNIGGQLFTATTATRFDETRGLLTLTSYVEATYKLEAGQRILIKLEVEVPPGAGDDNSVGKVENMGDDNPTAAGAAAVSANIWRIGGKDYVVLPSTQIIDANVAMSLGATATVNSYLDASSSAVATRIQSIALDFRIMLPLTTR